MSITTTVGSLPLYIATATVPALTTFFTPPASYGCDTRYVAAESADVAWSTYSRDGYSPPVDPTYYSCLPERIRGPHFSPGVCTQGQTIASITKYEAESRTIWQAQCCKSGLTISMKTIQNSPVPMCVSAISTPLPVRALYTTTYTNGVSSSFYEQVINDQSTVSNMTTMTRGTAIADPFYVAWEAKDLSLFPVAYATSLAQRIGVAFTPTATPASSTTSVQADSQTDTGFSSSTKIGIGVGVGLGAALLIALISSLFIIRHLRRRNRAVASYPDETTPAMQGHEGTGVVNSKWYQKAQPHEEMEMHTGPNELDSMPVHYVSSEPVELPGESMQRRY